MKIAEIFIKDITEVLNRDKPKLEELEFRGIKERNKLPKIELNQ